MANMCGDDRFELIAMARKKLIDGTNISDRPYEMDALDSILFRCWQMGWLDQLRDGALMTDTEKAALERRIDELCAEVEAAKHDLSIFSGRIVELNAENAKLRKLARQMYPYAKAHLQLGVLLGSNDTLSYDWALQMVELGIEVS